MSIAEEARRAVAYYRAAWAEECGLPGEYVMLDGATGRYWLMTADERAAVLDERLLEFRRSVYRWTTWIKIP